MVAGLAGIPVVRRRLIAMVLRLPPATHSVRVERDIRVPVSEGALTLATDVYHPEGAAAGPTVLVRTPYGRRGWSGALSVMLAQRFAERGYRVVCQDVRGRFGSSGEPFSPYLHERDDAAATAQWIVAQPWSDGRIATWGSSYLGYVQWALAAAEGPHPAAMVPITTSANLGGPGEDGAISLDTLMRWILTIDAMENMELRLLERLARIVSPRVQRRLLAPAFAHLPLASADLAVMERESEVWRMWVENTNPDDNLWEQVDHRPAVRRTTAAVHAVTGWFDLFLERQLDDYAALVEAGRTPHLTIGPWHHLDPRMQAEALRLSLDWFDAHLRGAQGRLRELPVRVWVSGAGRWEELPAWPPPSDPVRYVLAPGGRLVSAAVDRPDDTGSEATRYRYDPADPTPSVGGALLSTTAGSIDNTELESRPDVVTFTSEVLRAPVEIMGRPCVRLYVEASAPFFDVVARLCDVHPGGRSSQGASMNVADGYRRLTPENAPPDADGAIAVELSLSPLAHRFLPGHRIRLQVASGAHPRVARNLGTGEPPVHGTRMSAVEVAVHHDAEHPSGLQLPVMDRGDGLSRC